MPNKPESRSEDVSANVSSTEPRFEQNNLGLHANFEFQPQSQNVVIAIAPPGARSLLNAEEIAALKAADPAAAELFYRMTERQQVHDHQMDRNTLRSESIYRIAGICAAVLVIFAIVAVSALAIINKHPIEGTILGATAGLSAIAGVFVRGRALVNKPNDPGPPSHNPSMQAPMVTQRIPTTAPPPR